MELIKAHKIEFHEKKLGQLFCLHSARDVVRMLEKEAENAEVSIQLQTQITKIDTSTETKNRFQVETNKGNFKSTSLVIATGGLSLPKLGATSFGYEIAKQFGLKIVPTHPALDGFVMTDHDSILLKNLAGISLDCFISCNSQRFRENLLFTHKGLSGPAALQASLHWSPGDEIEIDILPTIHIFKWLQKKKEIGSKALIKNLLCEFFAANFAEAFCELYLDKKYHFLPLPEISLKVLEEFSYKMKHWKLKPATTVGYTKAEVTRGGVDTDELSSKTMESKKFPGLYFIGEVVDVTGWLGGYNFQWAWASAWAAAQAL